MSSAMRKLRCKNLVLLAQEEADDEKIQNDGDRIDDFKENMDNNYSTTNGCITEDYKPQNEIDFPESQENEVLMITESDSVQVFENKYHTSNNSTAKKSKIGLHDESSEKCSSSSSSDSSSGSSSSESGSSSGSSSSESDNQKTRKLKKRKDRDRKNHHSNTNSDSTSSDECDQDSSRPRTTNSLPKRVFFENEAGSKEKTETVIHEGESASENKLNGVYISESTESPYTDDSDVNMRSDNSIFIPSIEIIDKKPRNYLFTMSGSETSSENSEESNHEVQANLDDRISGVKRKYVISPMYYESDENGNFRSAETILNDNSAENIPRPKKNQKRNTRGVLIGPQYVISPMHSDESDVDLSDDDPTYVNSKDNANENSSDSEKVDDTQQKVDDTQERGRKRKKDIEKWKQNTAKRLRNTGEAYISLAKTHKNIPSRSVKPSCTEKCKLKCAEKIDNTMRQNLFTGYWKLGDLYKQRAYVKSCMLDITPKYKYTNAERPRKPNKAYYFTVDNNKIRVCKTFFKNTLDISDRMIFTIQQKTDSENFLHDDLRGKHGNHKKTSPELINDIKEHINSIPRIESHYLRASTTRQYIEGGKTIKDLYENFKEQQIQNNRETGNYLAYYKIFTTDFNISFFQPKKDLCDLCLMYENLNGEQKEDIEEKYLQHLEEKKLSRLEKEADRKNVTQQNKVVIYDLQAVLQCPRGDTSAFYYKSKLNSYNLTFTELTKKDTKKGAYDNVHCYFWTESDAKRGANEIGTCVFKYLEDICKDTEEDDTIDVIFYSDNCCGQNKNKYITTLYLYAVQVLNIKSITHKFLIRGHTQNEADSVHSLIEREVKKNLKSGPIYTPDQYITLIKNSKKSNPPLCVHELSYDSFLNLKILQEDWGFNFNVDESGQKVNWNDIKMLKVTKGNPFMFYYKTSYQEGSFKEVNVRNKRKKMLPITEINIKQLYTQRQEISANKKKDLKELISKGLIPSFYATFYNNII